MIFLAHLVSLHTRWWLKNFEIIWTLISDLVLEKKVDKHTNNTTNKQTTSEMLPIWGICYSFSVHYVHFEKLKIGFFHPKNVIFEKMEKNERFQKVTFFTSMNYYYGKITFFWKIRFFWKRGKKNVPVDSNPGRVMTKPRETFSKIPIHLTLFSCPLELAVWMLIYGINIPLWLWCNFFEKGERKISRWIPTLVGLWPNREGLSLKNPNPLDIVFLVHLS